GFFDPDYLAHFPVAVIEQGGEIVAFANIWAGPKLVELSADLMRYKEGAPREVMEALFVSLMVWGKAQGYKRVSLGMAPLSGIERSCSSDDQRRARRCRHAHGSDLRHRLVVSTGGFTVRRRAARVGRCRRNG